MDSALTKAFATLNGVNFVHVSDNGVVSLSSSCLAFSAFYSVVCNNIFSTFTYTSLH